MPSNSAKVFISSNLTLSVANIAPSVVVSAKGNSFTGILPAVNVGIFIPISVVVNTLAALLARLDKLSIFTLSAADNKPSTVCVAKSGNGCLWSSLANFSLTPTSPILLSGFSDGAVPSNSAKVFISSNLTLSVADNSPSVVGVANGVIGCTWSSLANLTLVPAFATPSNNGIASPAKSVNVVPKLSNLVLSMADNKPSAVGVAISILVVGILPFTNSGINIPISASSKILLKSPAPASNLAKLSKMILSGLDIKPAG